MQYLTNKYLSRQIYQFSLYNIIINASIYHYLNNFFTHRCIKFNISRMMLNYFRTKHIPINMCIDLSCCNRFMSKHTLYSTKIGPSLQQMRGKRVTKGVRTYVFFYASHRCQFFNHMKHHNSRNVVAPTG